MATRALIGLGSNLGDRGAHLDSAVSSLAETPGVSVAAVSTHHETAPAGGPSGQGAFLNASALVDTDLDPFALLARLHVIEALRGRVRETRWGERTLDLDLLLFGDLCLRAMSLTVPHPRMAVRRFVLAPSVEVAPRLVHGPTRRTLEDLLASLDRRPSVLALAGPPSRLKTEVLRSVRQALSPVDHAWLRRNCADSGPENWSVESDRNRWVVADYCPALDAVGEPSPPSGDDPRLIGRYDPADRSAFLPTFAVNIDPGGTARDWDQFVPFPVIVPESTCADGIVHEVVAACVATRGTSPH